ncbi:ASCH domain-containing protein [Morganella psychrotolerans]|nr:ASCH domain-containing protein [Morganella psychrotolerans]
MISDVLRAKYPGVVAWPFGDSPELADELAALVIHGQKRASCSSLNSFIQEGVKPEIGGYSIILNGSNVPVCVIRTISMQLVRFCDVTSAIAAAEGEGDLSLSFWQREHQAYFTREGSFSPEMELIFEEFTLIEVL